MFFPPSPFVYFIQVPSQVSFVCQFVSGVFFVILFAFNSYIRHRRSNLFGQVS